jgi:hypothetical protein
MQIYTTEQLKLSCQNHTPNFAQQMILCKISAANTNCNYLNRNKNVINVSLKVCDLHECKIQFNSGLFMCWLNSQLASTKMTMMTTNNNTDDSDDNDYHLVQYMSF